MLTTKRISLLFSIVLQCISLSAQVGISTGGNAPHPSAGLDIDFSNKGVLIPRMSEASRLLIAAPATGLMVYQTDGSAGFWYYDGSSWNPLSGGGGGGLSNGNNEGDLLYWDGSAWAVVPVGLPGQTMQLSYNGIPQWVGPTYPSLTTAAVSGIGGTIAQCGGLVASDGGSAVTARGLCWSTTPNPTTADLYSTNGSGTGSFTGMLHSMQLNTQYYVRAYATNAVGTAYGNQVTLTTNPAASIAVGESYEGGYIFYVDGSGQHGLVAAPVDQSTNAQWGCYQSFLGGTSTAFGSGQANTTQILNTCNQSGIAAELCDDLVLGGYSDWYLPSEDELFLAYQNLKLNGIGGFSDDYYWTSSEVHAWSSWFVYFSNAYQDWNSKDSDFSVRAIRNF